MTKLLLIDDAEDARNSIRRTLECNGFDVLPACHGKEGLQLLADHTVDVILTDVFMPEMEGLETIRHIREAYPNIPIVVMTGSLNDIYKEIGIKLGAVCGLSKPFNTNELLTALDHALEGREKDNVEVEQLGS